MVIKRQMKNKELLEKLIKESISIIEVLRKLGYCAGSRNYKTFKKYVEIYNLDTSHFEKSSGSYKFRKRTDIKSNSDLEKIFVGDIEISNTHDFKKQLYKQKVKHPICELCGQDENWKTGKISLILDHIDGNNKNNSLENLRIVCPNCDAALPTYKGKNRKFAA